MYVFSCHSQNSYIQEDNDIHHQENCFDRGDIYVDFSQ